MSTPVYNWIWFRVHYNSGHSEIVGIVDQGLRAAWARYWNAARTRERRWFMQPKAGWKTPPRVVKIDVIAEPVELIRERNMRAYVDEALRIMNNPP